MCIFFMNPALEYIIPNMDGPFSRFKKVEHTVLMERNYQLFLYVDWACLCI